VKYEKQLKALVEKQANDSGVFFLAKNEKIQYLQQEIRKLHALIEENEIDINFFLSNRCYTDKMSG